MMATALSSSFLSAVRPSIPEPLRHNSLADQGPASAQGLPLPRQQSHDHLANRKRCRESRALDAIEGDEIVLPVCLRPVDGKIARRLARAVELGADAGVVGVQARDLEARIIAADKIEELPQPLRFKAVIDRGYPGEVGAEFASTANVYGGVQAEPGAVRDGIDVALEGRAAGQRIVLPLGVVGLRWAIARAEGQRAPKPGGIEARGKDETPAADGPGTVASGDQTKTATVAALKALDRAAQHHQAAAGLDVTRKCQHQAMAVDDAG